jgi:holliday junction DNA helicase RuvA
MYEYFEGKLEGQDGESVIIDVQGIGYKIHVSKASSSLTHPLHEKIKLWTAFILREDSQTLYGFTTEGERELFYLLQNVSGVGPKTAMNILGSTSPHELAQAIYYKDTKKLSMMQGIGKKLAERLAVELHEKAEELLQHAHIPLSEEATKAKDAIKALLTLGFSPSEAKESVSQTMLKNPNPKNVEDLVRQALSRRK